MHFIHKIQCFEEFLHNLVLFFKKKKKKNCFFKNFNRSNLFLDRSKLWLKLWFGSVCFNRSWINQKWFSINQKSYREFFKTFVFHVLSHFQTFSKRFSLSSIGRRSKSNFCCFPPKVLQGFSPLRPIRPFYPSFCIYFCFMH